MTEKATRQPRTVNQPGFDHVPTQADIMGMNADQLRGYKERKAEADKLSAPVAPATHDAQPGDDRHLLRRGAIGCGITAAVLAVAVGSCAVGGAMGGAFRGSDAKPSYTPSPSPSASEQPTPKPSEAAGSASPSANPSKSPEASASASPSGSPEATPAPEFVSIKDGSVGENTIIKLPANTVITGDPFFFGGQPGAGQQLEDYQTFQFPVEQIKTQSLVNGQTLTDSDPTSGAVWVLKQDTYVQTGVSYGFSYNTLQTADQAEKFAIGQQFVTEHLGCSGGCQRVDIVHVPGEMQGPDGTTSVDGTSPSQSPMPSQDAISGLTPGASEMPLGNINLGSITKDQEVLFLENLINSGKVDMNSDTGKILANLLYCLECTNTVCTAPAPSESPKPTLKPSAPAVCTPTKKDTVEPAGFVFHSKNGEAFIVEAAVTIDGKQGFTTNNDSTKIKQVDLVNDGKNHTVVFNFPGDLQEFNNSCVTGAFVQDTYVHDLKSDDRALDPRSIKLTK